MVAWKTARAFHLPEALAKKWEIVILLDEICRPDTWLNSLTDHAAVADHAVCQTYFGRQPSCLLRSLHRPARTFPPHQPCHSLSLNHHYPRTLHCRVRGQSCGAFTSSVGLASGTVNCTMISTWATISHCSIVT